MTLAEDGKALDESYRSSATGARPAIDFIVSGHRRALARVAGTAYLGGVAEALFLITVTRAAFAITDGADRVGIVAGWYLSVNYTLLLGLAWVVARMSLSVFATWQSTRLSTSVAASMRHRLVTSFLNASWELQSTQRAGSLQELLTGYTAQASALIGALTQGVVAGANLVALVGIAIAVDPLGALVLVVSVGVLGLTLRPLRAEVKRRAQASTSAGMDFATSVNQVAELGLELHVFHVQDAARQRVARRIEQLREKGVRVQLAAGLTAPIYSGLAYLALLGALAVVALSDATSLASLGAAMLVMLRSLSYGQSLQGAYVSASASVPAIHELKQRLELFDSGQRSDGGQHVGVVGVLAADRVWFGYTAGEDVLRDVSFSVDPREAVGIVGPSGGGKSTLVQLLLGLRDPDRGRITANGRELGSIAKGELARKITFVPQAAHLVAGTIADNIRFMRDDVSQEDIERAARLAHIHEDILRFPEGYGREVGEHGGSLSGGQQQRLCIARALVEDPDVLIMDEPTSALDVRSEHLIRTTLMALKQRMTVIVIAHRLSTLDVCDRIMVIQDGELRGFDTPGALEASNDFYREALTLSGMR